MLLSQQDHVLAKIEQKKTPLKGALIFYGIIKILSLQVFSFDTHCSMRNDFKPFFAD